MKPEHKKYILENINKKSIKDIAQDLGIRERNIRKFLEARGQDIPQAKGVVATSFTSKFSLAGRIDALDPRFLFWVLFLVAFVIKVIVLIAFQKSIFSNLTILDMADYDKWALEIAGGRIIGTSAFNALPFYPYFLGFIYYLIGHSLFAVRFIQILLGSFTCVLIFSITKRMFNSTVAMIAFCLMLLFKEFYSYEMLVLPTTLGIFFYVAIIAMLFSALEKPRYLIFIFLGLVTGMAILNRAYALSLLIVIPGLIAYFIKKPLAKFVYIVLFLKFTLLMVSLATVHNYLASRDFVPITAHGGVNFFIGNNPSADGLNIKMPFIVGKGSKELLHDMKRIAEEELHKTLKPSRASSFWFSKGMDFIKQNPGAFMRLLGNKLNAFFCGFDLSDMISPQVLASYIPILSAFFVDFRFVIPLAIVGLWLTFSNRKEFVSIYAIIIGHVLSTILFIVVGRYRLAIAPIFVIFAAASIVAIFGSIASGKHQQYITSLIAVALLFVYLNNPSLERKFSLNLSANYTFLGGYFLESGDSPSAIRFFEKAVFLEPRRSEAHNMLGLGYFSDGQYDNSLEQYNIAINLNPNLYQAYNNMGMVFEKLSMPDKASSAYQKSLSINPGQPDIQERMTSLMAQ